MKTYKITYYTSFGTMSMRMKANSGQALIHHAIALINKWNIHQYAIGVKPIHIEKHYITIKEGKVIK